jgi:TorA maturation chaperone TorD
MGMPGNAKPPANLFWADIYAQLSEFFKEPSEGFAGNVASGQLARFFEERLELLGLDPSPSQSLLLAGDVRSELEQEYRQLFLGPLPPYIVPVESVYKRWAKAPECELPFASEKGYLMGDPALELMQRYRSEGIAIPEALSSMPDHIALELEYMSFLLINRDEKACKEFLANHLDWVDDLVRDIETVGTGGFYSHGAGIARVIIKRQNSGP